MPRDLTIKDPTAPATPNQTYKVFQMGGGDVRSLNLNKGQAATLIERLKSSADAVMSHFKLELEAQNAPTTPVEGE